MTRNYFSTLLVAALAACTIDARTEGADEGEEYEVMYTAPEAATSVALCENFDGTWQCATSVAGRSVAWSGSLDAVRLCKTPAEGGYVADFPFNTAPYHPVALDGLGGFTDTVGELHLEGPLPIVADPVDDGLGGAKFWIHLGAADCS